ncbi:EAL domain-containing protein [Mesobacillus subterraneus]|uniref:sensor domain-containing protein n=1 Tax=Mesobacillus subterraneus TaxID=285983 RepID=UPI00203A70E4|nr:GGDEF and EAL domain-containing protein [Mesobacillus subterraneus]MCM3666752.1 EAL domain-containing protein [Mesobacillus subterraneus]MCM3685648.1 EAL domain-containing protein [Mesobacillus subterraneus]
MGSDGKIYKNNVILIIIFILFAELIDWVTSFYFSIKEVNSYLIDISVTLIFMVFVIGLFRGMKNTADELQDNKKRLKSIFDTLDVAIWSHDLKTNTLLITSGIEKLYGYSSEEFYKDNTLWKKVIHPEDHHVLAERETGLSRGEAVTSVYRIIRPNGEVRWIQDRGIPVLDDNGNFVDFTSVLFDITNRQESEGRYRSLVEMSPDLIAVYSRGKLDYINEAGCKLFKAENPNDLIGKPIADLIPAEVLAHIKNRELTIDENFEEKLWFEFKASQVDGKEIDVEMSAMPILYEGRMAEQIVGRDLTQRKKAEKTIKYMAYYDVLTGLPNRNMVRKHLNAALKNGDQELAVLFLDLDRFKIINDTKGHRVGDLLLKVVASRLKNAVRDTGLVSRQGGDEFIILLKGLSKEEVIEVAERILGEFSDGIVVESQEFFVTPSIGISMAPYDGQDEETLIKHADTAMYLAKERGKNNYQFYTDQLHGLSSRKMELENGLRKALEQGQLMLHYQPQVNLETGKIIGVEALVRWQHPEKGIISPGEFISLAEETGLIVPLGKWVLEKASAQNKAWQDKGCSPIPISVNISVRQLQEDRFVDTVKQILADTRLDPRYLDLEITESVMQNSEKTAMTLTQLKELGVTLAIDDFGTGYSSLSLLKHLPIDKIKIDKSFVDDIIHHANQGAMVKTIIDMGHNLQFDVIAEGVEEQEQVAFLMANGCMIGQGYHFSRPLPLEAMENLLLNNSEHKGILR